ANAVLTGFWRIARRQVPHLAGAVFSTFRGKKKKPKRRISPNRLMNCLKSKSFRVRSRFWLTLFVISEISPPTRLRVNRQGKLFRKKRVEAKLTLEFLKSFFYFYFGQPAKTKKKINTKKKKLQDGGKPKIKQPPQATT